MAISIGTTSRQLGGLVRWAFAGVMIVGMLTWWWPGYRAWGALAASILGVFALWLLLQIVSGKNSVPGYPVHLVLLVPALILTYHLGATGLGMHRGQRSVLGGAMNLSMIFHFVLLAGGIFLSQSLPSQGGETCMGAERLRACDDRRQSCHRRFYSQ